MSTKALSTRFLIDTNDEHTIDEGEPFGNGWDTVLKSLKGMPSNALLLTDRYLFSATVPKHGNGIDNIQSILNVLLPKKFLGEYHVTIVFDNDSKNDNYKFNDIVYLLDNVKKALHRDYPINMEIVGTMTFTMSCIIAASFPTITLSRWSTNWRLSTRTSLPVFRLSPLK